MPAEPTGAQQATAVTDEVLSGWPLPEPGKDKEARGRVLIIGGTAHTPGAVLLAGEAALRAGAGKLQIATAKPVAAALAVAVPEALVVPMDTDDDGNIATDAAEAVHALAENADAVLLGPGFSDARASADLMTQLLPELRCPVVLDGVASAYLTRHRDGVVHLGGRVVLTVNPDELTQTLEDDDKPTGEQAIEAACRLAGETEAVVLLARAKSWLRRRETPGGSNGAGRASGSPDPGMCRPASSAVWSAEVPRLPRRRSGADSCTPWPVRNSLRA